MSERTDADLIREATARASWVRDWWFANRWLGAKGAVPEVRNLCDDVNELTAALDRLVAERDRLTEALREIIDLPSSREDEGPQIARSALAGTPQP